MQHHSSPLRGVSNERPPSSALSGSVSSLCGGDDSPHTLESEKRSSLSSKEPFSEDNIELSIENLEKTITKENNLKINDILELITCLSDRDKMLIQCKFPVNDKDDFDENDDENGCLSDFGVGVNQTEHSDALSWVMTHLEEDCTTCLKKQEVYDDYKSYCLSHDVKYLSTADFGKVMKRAFPNLKARRLGPRGKSRYCYSGLKNRNSIKSPILVDVGLNCINKTYNLSDERNSDKDSFSSNSQQPDLSNIPEFELSHNILIDSALVIMDFIKRVCVTKDITSLKQAVEHILLNTQVEMRTPHALRLLPYFQQIDNQRSKKKHLVDHVLNTIKKEETLSNPYSPHHTKKLKMSPAVEKILPYYPSFAPNNPYGRLNYNNNLPYYNHSMSLNMSQNLERSHGNQMYEMSPVHNVMPQKSFLPNTFSTPVKDTSLKMISPTLNSPLLDRNPSTTKKLDIPNSSKSINHNNINYQNVQTRTPLLDKSSKMAMYNSTLEFYDLPSNVHDHRPTEMSPLQNCSESKSSYFDTECNSPITMTSRNYDRATYDDYACDVENFDKSQQLKRRIGSDIDPGPILNGFDTDYVSISSGYCKQDDEGKAFLDTPTNSPTNRSIDHSEDSSRTHTPQTFSALLDLKDIKSEYTNLVLDQSPSLYHNMMNSVSKNIFSLDHTSTAQINHHMSSYNPHSSFSNERLHNTNDEFSVSSTTNICALDTDIHPSTTMLQGNAYK